jgi:hypothetical protein
VSAPNAGQDAAQSQAAVHEHLAGAEPLTEAQKRYIAPPCQPFTIAGRCDVPWPSGTPVTFPAVKLSTGEPITAHGVIASVPLPHAPYRMVRLANSGGRVIEVRCDRLAERRP